MHADVSVRRVAPASRKLASRTLMQTHRAQMENSRHPETLRRPDPRSKNSASHGTSNRKARLSKSSEPNLSAYDALRGTPVPAI